MDNQFSPLFSGEVLTIEDSDQFLISHHTFQSGEFTEALKKQLLEYGIGGFTEDNNAWFSEEGVECKVLRYGATGWKKGKVRINLEFCPDDTETAPQQQAKSVGNGSTSTQKKTVAKPENIATNETAELDLEVSSVTSSAKLELTESESESSLDLSETTSETSETEEVLGLEDIKPEEPELDLEESSALVEEEEELDLDLSASDEEELDLGESFSDEEELDLGESFSEDEELDLGESFSEDEELDLG
ncbi:MAG: KGK domain-containing protein, partial [Oscillatoria sp. PMC 1051.18]|nr:KGK domain-containing protein [Oscillatoria sp. PMC 1051.18]